MWMGRKGCGEQTLAYFKWTSGNGASVTYIAVLADEQVAITVAMDDALHILQRCEDGCGQSKTITYKPVSATLRTGSLIKSRTG